MKQLVRSGKDEEGNSYVEIMVWRILSGALLVFLTVSGSIPWEYKALAWIYFLDNK